MSVSYVHGQCKLHYQSQAKLPILLFVSCVLIKAQKELSADTAFVSDYLLDNYQMLWNLPALLFSFNYYSCMLYKVLSHLAKLSPLKPSSVNSLTIIRLPEPPLK